MAAPHPGRGLLHSPRAGPVRRVLETTPAFPRSAKLPPRLHRKTFPWTGAKPVAMTPLAQPRPPDLEASMRIPPCLSRFADDESAAVTVDWVVLTAAVLGLWLLAMNATSDGTVSISQKISSHIESQTVAAF